MVGGTLPQFWPDHGSTSDGNWMQVTWVRLCDSDHGVVAASLIDANWKGGERLRLVFEAFLAWISTGLCRKPDCSPLQVRKLQDISWGIAATQSSCGWIFDDDIVADLLLIVIVKEFLKSVAFGEIKDKNSGTFLWPPCAIGRPLYFRPVVSSSSFFFSSPILSHRRLDVCQTSTHDVALVRI